MIRTQVYIPDDLHRDLMFLARREGMNFSSLIREGVQEIIKKSLRAQTKTRGMWGKGFIGAGKTTTKTDAARNIRDYYLHGVIK